MLCNILRKELRTGVCAGKKKWKKQGLKDIEEKLEGFTEPEGEYKLIDVNDFSREELLEDNLITSKVMLIESSKEKEELYQNIEDVIENQENLDGDKEENNQQLETLIKYELTGTENENIIKKFIEKIKNEKGDEVDMTNASRIIRREMKRNWNEGLEEGKKQGHERGLSEGRSLEKEFLILKMLKNNLSIDQIAAITDKTADEIQAITENQKPNTTP